LHDEFLLFRKELLANYLALSLLATKSFACGNKRALQLVITDAGVGAAGAFFLLERFNYVLLDLYRVRCAFEGTFRRVC
jgi:hypothetical protein